MIELRVDGLVRKKIYASDKTLNTYKSHFLLDSELPT